MTDLAIFVGAAMGEGNWLVDLGLEPDGTVGGVEVNPGLSPAKLGLFEVR